MAQKFTVPITVRQLSSAGSDAITIYVDGDTYSRLQFQAGGRLVWGAGDSASDTNLYRDEANVLKTDDTFKAAALFVDGIEIDTTGAVTDQILKYDGTKFAPATGGSGGGASVLDDLTDVTISSASNGQVLKCNGTAWVNDTDNAGTSINYLDDVGDVTITSAAAGDFLQWNGTAWINESAPTYVLFDTSVGSPASTEGKLQWDSDFGTLSFGLEGNNSVQQIGINQFAYCYNADSVTLTKGTAVYIFGGQGSQVSIKRALNTGDSTSATTLGLVSESIAAGASGYVCTYGVLQGIDTTAYNEGDILYLGATAGSLTTTKPSAPNHGVFIGVVIKDAVGGEIWIRPQNGYELNEIHDVAITSATSGDFLKYNGTSWVNDPINLSTDTTGDYVASLVAGNGITLSNNSGEGATPTINAGATVSDSTPSSPTTGQLWYESDTGATFVYTGSAWVEVGATQGPYVCTSTTRPSSPYEGQLIYETDTNRILVYNASAWVMMVAADSPPGLELVKTTSFTTSNQVDVSDCFSSTYDNYRVELEWLQNTSTGNLEMKMRDSGGVISSNYGFETGGSYYSSGSSAFAGYNNSANETQTIAYIIGVVSAYRGQGAWDVFGPNLSRETNWVGQVYTSNGSSTLTRVSLSSHIRHNSATACTGFSLIPSAGTVTGTVRVYGYRNSV